MMHKAEPVIAVQGDDELTVAAGAKMIIGLCEKVGTDSIVIVELTIDDCVDRTVGRVERLSAIWREVVYSEADMAKGCDVSVFGAIKEWEGACGHGRCGGPARQSELIHWPLLSGPRCLIWLREASSSWAMASCSGWPVSSTP